MTEEQKAARHGSRQSVQDASESRARSGEAADDGPVTRDTVIVSDADMLQVVVEREGGGRRSWAGRIVVVGVLLLGLVGGALWLRYRPQSDIGRDEPVRVAAATPAPTPEPVALSQPAPTPTPEPAELKALVAALDRPFPSGLASVAYWQDLADVLARSAACVEKYPGHESLARLRIRAATYAAHFPARLEQGFDAALNRRVVADAERVLDQWRSVAGLCSVFGLTPGAFAEQTTAMRARMNALSFDLRVEVWRKRVAAADPSTDVGLRDLAATWRESREPTGTGEPEMTDVERVRRAAALAVLEGELRAAAAAAVAAARKQTLVELPEDGGRVGADGDALARLEKKHADLVELVKGDYERARRDVRAAAAQRAGRAREAFVADAAGATSRAVLAEVAARFEAWRQGGQRPAPDIAAVTAALKKRYGALARAACDRALALYGELKIEQGDVQHGLLAALVADVPEAYKDGEALIGFVRESTAARKKAEARRKPPPEVVEQPVEAAAPAAGTLKIATTPRAARVLVDDVEIKDRTVKVTPDVNHKVRVEYDGYRTHEQFYRVDAGKTKPIDVLLQKDPKKRFF